MLESEFGRAGDMIARSAGACDREQDIGRSLRGIESILGEFERAVIVCDIHLGDDARAQWRAGGFRAQTHAKRFRSFD
jgi:hypothetical protein